MVATAVASVTPATYRNVTKDGCGLGAGSAVSVSWVAIQL